MSKNEEWNEFLDNLLARSLENLQATREYEYRKLRQEQLDEMLAANLNKTEKGMVEEVLFELGVAADLFGQAPLNQVGHILKANQPKLPQKIAGILYDQL